MKKYFVWFLRGGEEYVIRFKIDGSLAYKPKYRCFEDKDWYVRTIDQVVWMAAGLHWDPSPNYVCGLISHEEFVRRRASGVKRWGGGKTFVIHWP